MIFNPSEYYYKIDSNIQGRLRSFPEPDGPIGNFGVSDVASYVIYTIMGHEPQAHPLLVRGLERIAVGVANNEWEWFRGYPKCHYLEAQAIGNWLLTNEHDEQSFNEVRRYMEESWRRAALTRQDIIRYDLGDYLALSVVGGLLEDYRRGKDSFEAGIDMYEHYVPHRVPSINKLLKPHELGYLLCRHYLNDEFDRADLLNAGRRMLAANLAEHWIEGGEHVKTALWLMTIHWYPAVHYGEELPLPQDILLKAWEDMPGLTRPF